MDIFNDVSPRLNDTKRFYFFEYFYILLKSVSKFQNEKEIFANFKSLKEMLSLGESRYKKLGIVSEELTNKQIGRYKYTFSEVTEECKIYDLLIVKNSSFFLTESGINLLNIYEAHGTDRFNEELFRLIEKKSYGFYYFVKTLYEINPENGGMLIFPIYSPLKLQLSRSQIAFTEDVIGYLDLLSRKIDQDVKVHLGSKGQFDHIFASGNERLIAKLKDSRLIGDSPRDPIEADNYYVILKRIRDHWLNIFLKEIYNIKVSLSSFDIWTYRAKQLGILNTTEFYPYFSGKIVYPVSILHSKISSPDFREIFKYPNRFSLFLHEPKWESFQEDFITGIYHSYYDLKRSNRSYFINLPDLSEVVCYKLKLSYQTFVEFLQHAYQLNLEGKLRIRISLEADRLPFETKAMYLKRDPIIIDGKLRNIIAIDLLKNE